MAKEKPSIMEQLQAPFPADGYEWRVDRETHGGKRVTVLCYVTSRHIQNRLDEIFGPFGWYPEYTQGPDGGVLCKLCCQDPETEVWIGKQDGAQNTKQSAVKGGISGALKRAGSVWGIGRLLYNLEASNVELKNNGQRWHKVKSDGVNKDKFMHWDEPQLPDWAVAGKKKKPVKAKPDDAPSDDDLSPDQAFGTRTIDSCKAALDTKLAELDKGLPDTKKKPLLELLCGSDTVAKICRGAKIKVPIYTEFGMKPDHASWEVLAKALKDMTIAQFKTMYNQAIAKE